MPLATSIRRTLLAGALVLAAGGFGGFARAGEPGFEAGVAAGPDSGWDRWEFRLQLEQVINDSHWQTLESRAVHARSKLVYENTQNTLLRIGGEGQPLAALGWLRIGADYAFDVARKSGRQRDYDRQDGVEVWYLTDTAVDPHMTDWNLNSYFRVWEFPSAARRGYLDVVAGYLRHTEYYKQGDVQTVVINKIDYTLGDFPNKPGYYKFDWEAARLGLRTSVPLSGTFALRAEAAGLRTMYEGRGWSAGDRISYHCSSSGWGGEAGLALRADLTRTHHIELGTRYRLLSAHDGTQENHRADGSYSDDKLDDAVTQNLFFFLGYAISW